MTELTLDITDHAADLAIPEKRYTFQRQGGTIGRHSGNHWVLPDPSCVVSGKHAEVVYDDRTGHYRLVDLSTNGTYIAPGQPCAKEGEILQHGDIVEIGDFKIQVSLSSAVETSTILPEVSLPKEVMTEEQLLTPMSVNIDQVSESNNSALYSSTFDGPLLPIDGLVESPETEPLATPKIPLDWDESTSTDVAGDGDIIPEHSKVPPAVSEIEEPIPVEPPVEAPPSDQPLPSHTATDAYGRLLSALGLPDSQVLPPEQLAEIFHSVTEGIIGALRSRNQCRQHFGLAVTTIQKTDNNPLSFSVNADDAIHNLFVKNKRAFMDSTTAYSDALQAINAHQYGVVAGMRAGFEAMLATFNPEALKRQLHLSEGSSWLSTLRSGNDFLTVYQSFYEQLLSNKEQTFMSLFGEAFTHAYEKASYRARNQTEQEVAL